MREKKYVKFFILFILLFAVGCNGVVFKTLVDNSSDTTPPDIVSVSSTGLYEVRVEYSEDVDSTTATDTSNYDISGLTVSSINVDSHTKVVRLTTSFQSFISYEIKISGIEDKKGNAMQTDYQGNFIGSQDAPRIIDVSTVSTNKIWVTFSEAVDQTPAENTLNYSISPTLGIISVTQDPELSGSDDLVEIVFNEDMDNTKYTIEVSNVTDIAGNPMDPIYKQESFAGDARPKILRISSTASDEILIQFSEDIDIGDVYTGDNTDPYTDDHVRVQNLDTPGNLNVTNITLDPDDSSKLTVTLGSNQTTNERYRVTLTGDTTGIKDSNGNYVLDNSTGFFIGDGPFTIVSVESNSPNTLIVTFSEEIRDTDGPNANIAAYFRIPGLSDPVLAASWPHNGDKSKVRLTTPTQNQQIYTLIVEVGSYYFHSYDYDFDPQTRDILQEGYNTLSFEGDGLPTVLSAVALDSNSVKINFSESVNLLTAQSLNNYSITSTGYPSLTISEASRNPEPNSNEVILTTSTHLYVNYTVTVIGIQDTTGNTISGNNTADFAGIGTDNTPPSILSATAPSTSTVRIYFNEPVEESTAETASNYSLENLATATITVTGQPTVGEWIDISVDVSIITLTAQATENTASKYFAQTGSTEDIAYSIVKCINGDPSSPVRAYANGSAVELISKTYGIDGDIIVDDMNITNVSAVCFDSQLFTPTTATRSGGNSTQVDISGFTVLTNGLYVLKVVNVEDLATPANSIPIISPATTIVAVRSDTDIAAPLLMGVYAEDATHIRLLFDEPLEFLSANVAYHYAIEREIAEVIVNEKTDKTTPDKLYVYWDSSSVTKYGDTTNGDPDITNLADTDGLSFGMNVFGENIPPSTTITTVGINQITLSNSATGTATGVELTFIDMASANEFEMTAAQNENIPAGDWAADNDPSKSATSIANVINLNSSCELYAHAIGDTVYLARTAIGSGTIDLVYSDTFSITFTCINADYSNNRTIISSARNEAFPREVILTLSSGTPLETGHDYGITANSISDISVLNNKNYGGTRVVLPLGNSSTPSGDTTPPEIVGAEAISDSLIRVVFSEPVEEISAENISNYIIVNPNLNLLEIISAIRDDNNQNVVRLYTEYQSPVIYTLTVSGIQDQVGNPVISSSTTFSGMGAVSVNNGPVGNTINGIGNLGNKAITAMSVYNGKLYVATYNEPGNIKMTELFSSDASGVYFTMVNNPGFSPPVDSIRQRTTTSFASFDIDDDGDDDLLASTADAPSDDAYIFQTLYPGGIGSYPHTWSIEKNMGNDSPNRLLSFGLDESTEHLYILTIGGLYYWDPDALPAPAYKTFSIPSFNPNCYIDFGGRMYIGGYIDDLDGKRIVMHRSKGANAGFPQSAADFEKVLDAALGAVIGMDGYDEDDNLIDSDDHYEDSKNTNVTSIAVFKGYIYIGTTNIYGAQVWRSQDGLTWERVLDFGYGDNFNGIGDDNNTRITSMKINGNYLYIGTRSVTGAEVWRTPDGITWDQFGSDGFGALEYIDVTSMESFLNLIYFGMEANSGGGAIFRSNN